jgi:DNA-binding NarL/FixJ family response regulator
MIEKLLTPSELRVLTLVSEGWSNHEIAQRLSISVNTVETHIQKIYKKLGLPPDDTPPAAAAGLRSPGQS